MKMNLVVYPVALLCAAGLAFGQTKVGTLNVAQAIQSTKDGQKAATDLQAKFAPKKADIDRKQAEIQAWQDQLRKGTATMSPDARTELTNKIDAATKSLNRSTEDAQADLDQEQGKVMQELGAKLMEIVVKYGADNGYVMIVDISNPQSPILWASAGADITAEIIKLYDAKYASAVAAPAAAAPKPAPVAAPRPPAKKQ